MEARANSRDNILDAAQRVAEREGAGNLTLDKVACECGLSKGGLLYNFPNKDALLEGMLHRLIAQHEQIMETEEKALEGEADSCLRAILRATASHQTADPSVYMSILAASAQKPELLEPVRAKFQEMYHRVTTESTDPDTAMVLWLATEGMLFHSILGISSYPESVRNALFQKILTVADRGLPQPTETTE